MESCQPAADLPTSGDGGGQSLERAIEGIEDAFGARIDDQLENFIRRGVLREERRRKG